MPNRKHILDTIGWAIWNGFQEGCYPPDWVLKLHWQCTMKFGAEYLTDVAQLFPPVHESQEPKKALRSRSRSAKPDEADDGEGGPRRKRQRSLSVMRPHCQHHHGHRGNEEARPKKKQCHHQQPHHGHRGREPKPSCEPKKMPRPPKSMFAPAYVMQTRVESYRRRAAQPEVRSHSQESYSYYSPAPPSQ